MRRLAVLALLSTSLTACTSVRVMRAENAYGKGDIDTAQSFTEAALADDPKDLRARKLGSRIATRRGVEALEHHDAASARRFFQRAHELDPADEVASKYLDDLDREEREQR